ncbi:MAG TPA: zinc-dependent metalloprotease family protein [Pyrinomonadaceae bacterium]|nr:zinc-dependent metalloprotease family protein [Pyrinomonadaceae bacterium]
MKHRTFSRAAALSLIFAFIAAAAFFASPSASSQDRRRVREAVERAIINFDELSLDPSTLLSEIRKTGRMTLATSHGTFELEVEPFDIRTDNYRAVAVGEGGELTQLPRTPSRAFQGKVIGMADTHVRLVLDEGKFQGIIVTPTENYYIQSERDFSPVAGSKDFVFYAGSSVKEAGGECGTTLAETIESQASGAQPDATQALKGSTTGEAFGPEPEAEVATDADFEFVQQNLGSAPGANQDILDIITQVDAIYDAQMGIKIRVVFQRAFTQNNDPYTLTDASPALTEFRTSYAGSFAPGTPPARDLTHLFTGKDLDGGTIGIAFIAAICDAPAFAFGISQSRFSATTNLRVGLTAHEMGHNFSANHPNQESPQQCTNEANIMNSSIQNTLNFCQFSRDEITNHVAGSGGSCMTRLTQPGCTYSISPTLQGFPASGGAGSVNVTTSAGCNWDVAEGAPWLSVTSGVPATGPGTATFTVEANAGGPRNGIVDIGGQKLTVVQPASTACGTTQLTIPQTVNGDLSAADCRSGQAERATAAIDLYTFTARAGQRIRISMSATGNLDTFLYLFGPDGTIVAENDDIILAQDTNSRIPLNGFLTLPATGIYTIEATSFSNDETGGYTLSLTDNSSTNSAALSSSAFAVNEGVGAGNLGTDGTGFRVVNVTRTGTDVSGTATVDFATSDGSALQRKDYEQTLGTLVFAPGQTSKSFTVLVPDDRFDEAAETINITLSNPVGMTLGSPSVAQLTINDNDAADAPSPVRPTSFDTAFYVRQQYLDFLNREPDASGFAFWQNEINSCATEPCREVRRINVSGAFFLSIEFQETGFLVERTYKTAFGDAIGNSTLGGTPHTLPVPIVRLGEFLADTQRIGEGVIVTPPPDDTWKVVLESNKQAFFLEFVLRQRFLAAYPLTMTPAQFVDTMNTNTGNVLTPGQRDALIAQLAASANVAAGRASVLRQIAENATLEANEKNRAFVLEQFFGYLRRNPNDPQDTDHTGYEFWLQKLNQFGGDFVKAEMVKAFITSDEYVGRFGT